MIEQEAAREAGRLSEDDFVEAIASGDYVLLDARSAANFERRHVVNDINLPFTEFDEMSLGKVIPEKDSKILIYCNNNFVENTPSMFTKSVMASLNVNTQASLRAYGYENIFELGPSLSLKTTKLNFEGTEVAQLGY
ncbi:MAG: rhodanese-like domain-containing protein [Verrucomicrobiota bacterium]